MKKIFLLFLLLSTVFSLSSWNLVLLENYNFREPKFVHKLDMGLNEISGLAVNDEGRLFAHNDEVGGIFELDPKNGRIIKWFWLGPNKLKEDFEAIAIAGKEIYLITSNGLLYKFYEQPDGKYAEYDKIRTGFTGSFEIEGMCYDPKTNSLIIASKGFPGKGIKNSRGIYSYNLRTGKLSDKPRFLISLDELEKKYKINNFSPSSIEVDNKSGHFFILSSDVKGILEISASGRILNFNELEKKDHPQPEGLTFLKDGTLLISDEARKSKATLTGYSLK